MKIEIQKLKSLYYRKDFLLHLILFSIFYLFSSFSFAQILVDVYKTNQFTAEDIKKKSGIKLKKIEQALLSKNDLLLMEKLATLEKLIGEVLKDIYSMGDFKTVSFEPVLYPGTQTVHFTIEVVDKKDEYRLAYFFPEPNKTIADPDQLIKRWLEFTTKAERISQKVKLSAKKCPAHHCLYGFEHKDLKPYMDFDQRVNRNKKRLISILRQDKDPEKRAHAAFLLAHLKNPDEVIQLLSPSIFDPVSGVRNNVMRVIGETLYRNNSTHFPIEKVVTALDFPGVPNRNKALLIIDTLVKNPAHAEYVRKYAGEALLAHLKMQQPNLHDTAYGILKNLSGKKFHERDYKSWENWITSVKG